VVDSRSGRALLGLLIAPLALAPLAGCTGPSTPPIRPVQVITGPPGRSADPAEVKAAGTAALAAYEGYFKAYAAAGTDRNWDSRTIDEYAADPARAQAHLSLRQQSRAGIVFQGEPVSTPIVTTVNIQGSPKAVSIADCVDATNWRKYDTKTKAYVAVSPLRYGVTALVVDYPGIGWLVQQVTETKDKC
jgi:hypothetical protein